MINGRIAPATSGKRIGHNRLISPSNIFFPPFTQTSKDIPIYLKLDAVGKLFYVLTALMWIPVSFYSFEYMKHEEREVRYYSFFLLTLAVLLGISSAGNLITMYLFYEGMSLSTLGLIIHNLEYPLLSSK